MTEVGTDSIKQIDECIAYKESLLAETREELQKADTKASILLAASGIALSALLTALAAGTWSPSNLSHGDAKLWTWMSIAFALIAFCFIGAAVKPRLRPQETKREVLHYFGDVHAFWPKWYGRNRDQAKKDARKAFNDALVEAATAENHEKRLDDQIWVLGHIAFRKYRFVSLGIWIFGFSILVGIVALVTERF